MICIVCFEVMVPSYDILKVLGSKVGKKVLIGYRCIHCREMMGRTGSDFHNERDLEEYLKWRKQYERVLEHVTIPDGYSFP